MKLLVAWSLEEYYDDPNDKNFTKKSKDLETGMVTNELNLSTCVILSGKDLYLFYILLKLMVKYPGNPL